MAEETGKKIVETINKLVSNPPRFSTIPVDKRSGETPLLIGRKRSLSSPVGKNLVRESLSSLSGSSETAQTPNCKPWDRHEFFFRLSTFKSITWFAKPRVVSPLECARRGWINADVDTIVCSSCGARLLFATPSFWTRQQVEKAAKGFSLKLDTGHKASCLWINNACAEEVSYFPNILDSVLAEDYKRRTASLLQLIALPAIPLSVVGNLRSSQLAQFLGLHSNSLSPENGVMDESESVPLFSYCQAKKLISLLGWEPYLLPHEVASKDGQDSIEDAAVIITTAQNQRLKVYSLCAGDGTGYFSKQQFDPSSVILHCKLCGSSVGLGAFNNIPPSLEYLRFVGPEEIIGTSVSTLDDVNVQEGSSGDDPQEHTAATTVIPSLSFTIAGGPPPALLDYAPSISLPIIGKNLRLRIADDTVSKDPETLEMPAQVESHQLSRQNENFPVEETSAMPQLNSVNEKPVGESLTVAEDLADSSRTITSTESCMQTEGRDTESDRQEIDAAEVHGHSSSQPSEHLVIEAMDESCLSVSLSQAMA